LDELARFLPAGTSKDDALSLLNDPKFVTAVGAHLDANADQSLSLSEVLQVDVLTAARGVATELFPNDPRQEVELGKDERVRTWTTWYQKKVGERLQLGAANEEGDPTIPLP
jgi:hypothetical protein